MLDPTARGELDLCDVPFIANNDFGRTSPQFHIAPTEGPQPGRHRPGQPAIVSSI